METLQQLSSGHGLIEGPLFDPARGLLFTDTSMAAPIAWRPMARYPSLSRTAKAWAAWRCTPLAA